MKKIIVVAVLSLMVLLFTGCVQQLQDLNAALGKANGFLAPNSAGTPVASRGGRGYMPSMSDDQARELRSHLMVKLSDRALAQAKEEAAATIEKILAISACYPDYDIRSYLSAYAVAGSGIYYAPMTSMKYHPKSQCLRVTRVSNWKMNAKNAISFSATYVSEASDESSSLFYQMTKEPDGMWLLRDN